MSLLFVHCTAALLIADTNCAVWCHSLCQPELPGWWHIQYYGTAIKPVVMGVVVRIGTE